MVPASHRMASSRRFFKPAGIDPDQLARLENKLPAYTVGSLAAKIKVEGMLATFEQIILSDALAEKFKEFANEY